MKNAFRLSLLAISIILLSLVWSISLLGQDQAADLGSNASDPPMLAFTGRRVLIP
jgi:hypothetical protein